MEPSDTMFYEGPPCLSSLWECPSQGSALTAPVPFLQRMFPVHTTSDAISVHFPELLPVIHIYTWFPSPSPSSLCQEYFAT